MTKQVTRKEKGDLILRQSCLGQRQINRILLKTALRVLPGLTPKHIILAHRVKQKSQGSLPLLCAHHTAAA